MRYGNLTLRHTFWLITALTVIYLMVWQAPALYAVPGLASYLPLHMFAETFSIVVAVLVFGIAWNAYSAERPGNIIIIACALLAVALIDFAHMLSFTGMPDFVTPGSPEKAINLWLSARLIAALMLLAVALRGWQPFPDPRTRYSLLATSLAIAALVTGAALYFPQAWPRTFIDGQGLTPFKIGAEYAIIAILLIPAVRFFRLARQQQSIDSASLFAATAITILSELCFTLYSDVADVFNMLGHLYKIIAYAFIYRAVFVSSVHEPFRRLDAELEENRQITEELKLHREHLQEMIAERTAQLVAANKDLESFSYSVSHDLRAPLRAIDGFSLILLEDYHDKLDDEGKRLLAVVRDNTNKMGQMISDILQFSRAGRTELARVEIDMEALVQSVWQELAPMRGRRQISFQAGSLPVAYGDRSALTQVMTNLLSNAIKFTGPCDQAIIEVGGNTKDNELVYYVRDNGAGFDMQYADKLFGVFQRLHGMEEFEGTGIGLAIVKRIINKHGGRVWAEGKVNEGAVFYFTLPPATVETHHE